MFSPLPRSHSTALALPEVPVIANVSAAALAAVLALSTTVSAAAVQQHAAAQSSRRPKPAQAPVRPQILAASVSPIVVGSGTVVSAVVHTTPGVVSVTVFAGGLSMPVPRVGTGMFSGSTTLPPLPPFAHGSYPVTFVAHDARGASTQSAVSVTVR